MSVSEDHHAMVDDHERPPEDTPEFEVWRDDKRITSAQMEAGAIAIDAYLRSKL